MRFFNNCVWLGRDITNTLMISTSQSGDRIFGLVYFQNDILSYFMHNPNSWVMGKAI
jgi:hypothetical protein